MVEVVGPAVGDEEQDLLPGTERIVSVRLRLWLRANLFHKPGNSLLRNAETLPELVWAQRIKVAPLSKHAGSVRAAIFAGSDHPVELLVRGLHERISE